MPIKSNSPQISLLHFQMDHILKFQILAILILAGIFPPAEPFTVVIPDSSGVPSALVDAPQTGFTINGAGARTDSREQDAVYEIMRATGNQWATDIPDVCRGRWHGIECMPDKDNVYHVVSLSFGALSDDTAFPTCDSAKPFISPAIAKLPHLRTLFFYRCFTSNPNPIPSFLGKLGSSLQTLVLRENGFIGSIPTEIGNLTRLKVLDLHKNELNGSIPGSLSRLTGLRSLDLSRNQLTGPIPNFTFPELNILDLNQNHLTGPIPNALISSPSFMKIDMGRNCLSGLIPESITSLNNLILLDLSFNALSGPFPLSLKGLGSLQALILNDNPTMSSAIPDEMFDELPELMTIVFSDMNLQGPIPESMGRLKKLRVAHLDKNNLSGPIPTSFGDLNGLSELRLDNNILSGRVPFNRDTVWRMRRKLRLGNNLDLCYDVKSGLSDDLDALADSGVGPCEVHTSGLLVRPIKHVSSTSSAGGLKFSTNSAALRSDHKASVFSIMLLQLATFFVLRESKQDLGLL